MGPPVATIEASGGGWTVHGLEGDAAALADATGTDKPDGSWKKVWYRAVAWAHPAPDRALLPGRSPASNAMSVVIPPDGPPNLSPLTAEWPGGPLQVLDAEQVRTPDDAHSAEAERPEGRPLDSRGSDEVHQRILQPRVDPGRGHAEREVRQVRGQLGYECDSGDRRAALGVRVHRRRHAEPPQEGDGDEDDEPQLGTTKEPDGHQRKQQVERDLE